MRLRTSSKVECLCGHRVRAAVLSLAGILRSSNLLLVLCIVLATRNGRAWAQGADDALTVEQCVQRAQEAPSLVRQAHQQSEAARRAQESAGAAFLPQLNIVNGFIYNSPLLYNHNAFSFVALNGVREYMTVANASLDVDTSGRIKAGYDHARANMRGQKASEVIATRDLRAEVTAAYYRLLLTRKLADAASENAAVVADFKDKIQKLLDAGEASRADLSRATAEAASLQRTAVLTRTAAANANHELASYWTEDVTQELSIVDDLEQQFAEPKELTTDQGFLRRPEFNFAQAQIDLFRADSHAARAAMLPQLSLNFEYGFDTNQLISQNRGYAGFVHLDIPVFDFFRAYNDKRSFDEQTHAAQTNMAILKRQMSREYQDALSEVKGIYASLSATEEGLHAAQESLRLSRERFDGGEGSALEVVTAENAFVQAQIDFYSNRADLLNAQSALKVASGQ